MNGYKIETIYDEIWEKYETIIKDKNGNACTLWYNEDETKFYMQDFIHKSGKYCTRRNNIDGMVAVKTRLSNEEYSTMRKFRQFIDENKQKIFSTIK